MQPLPKLAGWLSIAGSVGAVLLSVAGYLPAKWAMIAASLGTLLANVSHSLNGTGGQPEK